jgi:predicted RNase H-like nuclease (RuvC/YqgF family)
MMAPCMHCRLVAGERSNHAAPSFELSQQRCSQLEEQVEQQQKVIRILQAQLESLKNSSAHQQQLQQQRQLNALARPGSGGASAALRQQVLTLQQDKAELCAQLEAATSSMAALSSGGGSGAGLLQPVPAAGVVSRARHLNSQQQLLSLTSTDMAVLVAAKEALAGIAAME